MTYFSDLIFLSRVYKANSTTFQSTDSPCYELHFVPRGSLWWARDDEPPALLPAPLIWWSAPSSRVVCAAPQNESFKQFSLGLEGERLARWIGGGLLSEGAGFAFPNEGWGTAFVGLWDRFGENLPRSDGRATLVLEELLLQLNEEGEETAFATPLEGEVAAWIERVRSAPQIAWSIEREAQNLGVSPSHLRRITKKLAGAAPYALILAARLERAALALRSGNAPIKQIADENGFEDVGYFTRLFCARFGVPPARYRRAARLMAQEIARIGRRSRLPRGVRLPQKDTGIA